MKKLIQKSPVIVFFFTCLSSFINGSEQSYLDLHRLKETGLSKYQHHSAKLNALQDHSEQYQLHVVLKRQTIRTQAPEDEAYCFAKIDDVACSTGLTQGFIDAELTCGTTTIEEATRDAKDCAINEHGKYCLSAWRPFNVNNIEGNCSGVLASGACSAACRTLLEDFRSRLGCCIKSLVNNTRMVSSGAASVDYRVWNLCGVPLLTADCENNPVIVNPPDNVQQCTAEQSFNMMYTENLCLPERGQPYVDAIVLDSRCNQTWFIAAEYITNLCSMDDSGRVCGRTYTSSDPDLLDLETLNSDCATSNVSCTSNCRSAINNAKIRGCCVNWINSSMYTPHALSYGVWKSCGVESPGFCESPLNLRGSATSIMEENHLNFLLVVITGLICQYVGFMGQ
jgi:hypothetical protein